MPDSIAKYLNHVQQLAELKDQWVHHECLPASDAQYSTIPDLNPQITQALQALGINQLYSHQADAIDRIRKDKEVGQR